MGKTGGRSRGCLARPLSRLRTKAQAVERSYGFFFCMSGPNSATASAAYARTRQRQIEDGDLVMIHANTCADGLLDRHHANVYSGQAPYSGTMRCAPRSMRRAKQHSPPFVPASRLAKWTVQHASDGAIMALADAFKHATGHGVGFAAANPNGLPRIHPKSPDVLEEGMTFNVEPAAYFDGYGGMRHCDVVAVTCDGATFSPTSEADLLDRERHENYGKRGEGIHRSHRRAGSGRHLRLGQHDDGAGAA